MAKRLKTYRLEPDECADFAWAVGETGETESDVLRRAVRAYIQWVKSGRIASVAPVEPVTVYTDVESPVSYDEPAAPPCKHPAEYVDGGECRNCGQDVW